MPRGALARRANARSARSTNRRTFPSTPPTSATAAHDSRHENPILNGETTMQYMLMCCFDETAWNSLPDAQKDKIMRDYGDWIPSLVRSGHFRGGAKLHP